VSSARDVALLVDEVQIALFLARADLAADSHGHFSDIIGAIHAPIGTKPALTCVLRLMVVSWLLLHLGLFGLFFDLRADDQIRSGLDARLELHRVPPQSKRNYSPLLRGRNT
jgi:hypothetical protein